MVGLENWTIFMDVIFVSFLTYSKILYVKDLLSGLRRFLAAESPLKMLKNDFYFMLKALFVLKIFNFLYWIFGHVEKRLGKKAKVLKFMTSQTGQQIITIHILPNISRNKGNQTIKFCQLIEYNKRSIIFKNHG